MYWPKALSGLCRVNDEQLVVRFLRSCCQIPDSNFARALAEVAGQFDSDREITCGFVTGEVQTGALVFLDYLSRNKKASRSLVADAREVSVKAPMAEMVKVRKYLAINLL